MSDYGMTYEAGGWGETPFLFDQQVWEPDYVEKEKQK